MAEAASKAIVLLVSDAETAHSLALWGLRSGLGPIARRIEAETNVCGISFSSPVGLAAGFDKQGQAVEALAELGFGFVEIGGVTLKPQSGNERPRIFRVGESAIVNRVGLPSEGVDVVAARLEAITRTRKKKKCVVAVNVAKQRNDDEFAQVAAKVAPYCDLIVVNVSCPNVSGGLVDVSKLRSVLNQVRLAVPRTLVFAKVSPDLGPKARAAVADALLASRVDGIVVANTTKRRPGQPDPANDSPPPLAGTPIPNCPEPGGLSGPPLTQATRVLVADFYKRTRLPIIGVGGVSTPEDAYALVRAGASLVQLYTALVYAGPSLPQQLNTGLLRLANNDGFDSVQQAVGADHRSCPDS